MAAAAAADRVLCSRACALQGADKAYADGTLYVYQSLARFVARGGGQRLELDIADVKGQKRSKNNPLLMLETGTKGRIVLKFNSLDEREQVVAAITQAQAAAGGGDAAGAAGAAAGGGAASAAGAAAAPGAAAAARGRPASAGGGASAEPGSQLAAQLTPQQRQQLLASNTTLAAHYRSLVTDSQALSEAEFWASPAVQRAAGLTGVPTSTPRSSRRGLANKLVDLARQHETAADAKMAQLHMTAEDEAQLLAEKPGLRAIYDAQVGIIMSKEEFWTRYFRYYMAKRSRREKAASRFKALQQSLTADSAAVVAGMAGPATTAQAAAAETEELEMEALFSTLDAASGLDAAARKALQRRLNPAVDLAAAAEDRLTAEGHGLAHNSARSETETVQGFSALSRQLALDYNIHSAAVIGATPQAAAASAASAAAGAAGAGPSAAAAAAQGQGRLRAAGGEASEEELRRFKEHTGSGLEDLQAPVEQQFEELRVTHPRNYFSTQPQQLQQQQQAQQHAQQQQQSVAALLRSINPQQLPEQPMQPGVALQVLNELAGGDDAAAGRGGRAALPQERLDFMQQQAMVVDELLRHFWGLLPVNTPEKEAKLGRIQRSIDACYELLNKVVAQCEPLHKAALTRLVKPLWDQLDVATAAARNVQRALANRAQGRKRAAPPAQQQQCAA